MIRASTHRVLQVAAEGALMAGCLDLPQRLPHIVAADELPMDFPHAEQPDGCTLLGYTGWRLGELLRPILGPRGQWFGDASDFAAVIHLDRFVKVNPYIAQCPELLQFDVNGTVAHELAHHIEYIACKKATMAERKAGLIFGRLDGLLNEGERWAHHGAAFVRCAAHVQYRTYRNGWQFGVLGLGYAGRQYGLRDWSEYFSALEGECDAAKREPIASVLRTPIPKRFAELWAEDTCGATI